MLKCSAYDGRTQILNKENKTIKNNDKMKYYSAWEDVILQRTESVFDYRIYDGTSLIFQGRAYKRPNADTNDIKLNKIFENYLSNSINVVLNSNQQGNMAAEASKLFSLMKLDTDGTEILIDKYRILYDWSYDFRYRGENTNLSRPINGRYVAGMYKMNTSVSGPSGIVANSLTAGAYNVLADCGDYALYYLNAYGGWDALLIDGTVLKKSTITQYTTDRNINNNRIEFEQVKYINEIQDAYEINTGFLTDEQAANLSKNLIPSKEVYLHIISENKIIPVLITDTSVTYQTYQTNNLQMPQYKINVKESQIKLRK